MGSTHQTIYMPDALAFRTPLPPLEEQDRIIAHVDERTRLIDAAIDREKELIDLLRDVRKSLIAEAVTGKIDVREEVTA